MQTESLDSSAAARLRSANRRTALVLLSIALVFFVGVIATHFIGDATTGIAVIGSAVLLFLVVAIGRNLRVSEEDASQGPEGASPGDRGDRQLDAFDPREPPQRPRR